MSTKRVAILSADAIKLPIIDTTVPKIENGVALSVVDKCMRPTAVGIRCMYFAEYLSKHFDVTVFIPDLNYSYGNVDTSKVSYNFKPFDWKESNWKFSENLHSDLIDFDVVIIQTTAGTGFLNCSLLPEDIVLVVDAWVPFLEEFQRSLDIYSSSARDLFWSMGNYQYSKLMRRADVVVYANDAQRMYYDGLLSGIGCSDNGSRKAVQFVKIQTPILNRYIERESRNSENYKFLWYGPIYPWYDINPVLDLVNKYKHVNVTFSGVIHPRFKKVQNSYYQNYHEILSKNPNIVVKMDYCDDPKSLMLDYCATLVFALETTENFYSNRSRIIDSISYGLPVITNKTNPLVKEDKIGKVIIGVDPKNIDFLEIEKQYSSITKDDFFDIYDLYSIEKCFSKLLDTLLVI